MKRVFVALASMVFAIPAMADAVYPYSNPTYIPTASSPVVSYSAPADYTFTANGLSTAVVQITGTCTNLTAAFQGTTDGTNYVTLPLSPIAGGANITSVTAAGVWRANVAGLPKVRLHITALTAACAVSMSGTPSTATNAAVDASGNIQMGIAAGTAVVGKVGIDQTTDGTTNKVTVTNAQTPVAAGAATATNGLLIGGQYDSTQKTLTNGQQGALSVSARGALFVAPGADVFYVQQAGTVGDPCANPSVLKSSVAVALGASTTTALVNTSGTTVIYVCGFVASASGTNPTFTFKTGTQTTTACDTGAANLSGAIIPSATTGMFNMGIGHTGMRSAVGGQLCVTTAATTSVQGVMTYVQQ